MVSQHKSPAMYRVLYILAATKQPYEWFSPPVRPSIRLYVYPSFTAFGQCSSHRIIMKFSGVITIDKRNVHAKGQGQGSKVKVTEFKTQFSRFLTVTAVWIHIWRGNWGFPGCNTDGYEMMHKAWSNIEQGLYCFSRPSVKFQCRPGPINADFDQNWAFPDCNSSLNSAMALNWCTKLGVAEKRCPIFDENIHQISWSYGPKNQWFESNLGKFTRPVTVIKSLRFALLLLLNWTRCWGRHDANVAIL